MTRRQRTASGLPRRPTSSMPITTRTQAARLAPVAGLLVESVAEQPRRTGTSHNSPAIVVRPRRQDHTDLRLAPVRGDDCTALAPPDHAVALTAQAAGVGPLAGRPVRAPEVLLRRQPFRRHIEESRPYLVLGEGLRMINAHPVAVMVFWGGLTNWVLSTILAGHQAPGEVRLSVGLVVLAGWLLITLARIGKLGDLQESVRAIWAVQAGPATWACLKLRERSAFGRRLSTLEANMRWCEGGPARALIPIGRTLGPVAPASRPEHVGLTRRRDGSEQMWQGEEDGG